MRKEALYFIPSESFNGNRIATILDKKTKPCFYRFLPSISCLMNS